jgi:hypothetical protein
VGAGFPGPGLLIPHCALSIMATSPHPAVLPSVTDQTVFLKNISTDTSGYYICTASNEVGTASCNITVAVRLRKSSVGREVDWGLRPPWSSTGEPL